MSGDIVEIGVYPNIFKCNKFSIDNNVSSTNKILEIKKINIIYQIINEHIRATIIKKELNDDFCSSGGNSPNKKNNSICQISCDELLDFIHEDNIKLDTKKIFSFLNSELSKTHIRETILTSHYYYRAIFFPDTLINEILLSYAEKNKIFNNEFKEKILYQFLIDFPRMKICYNNVVCSSVNIFKEIISKYTTYQYNCTETAYYLIIMLCTQATFFYPYNLLHDIYGLPDTNIFIIQGNDHPSINLIENKNKLTLYFFKSFNYIDINNKDIPIMSFHTCIKASIKFKDNNAICKNIEIFWYKNKNIITI